ncbi:MAG: hypothetical protein JRN39_07945 [Nitrososphaerota archaeon]|nr:hypothetical protein [Nitrososphaerota archaeon]MDG6940316.1 hypothetical protein [Nitrososphaerota archaeon]
MNQEDGYEIARVLLLIGGILSLVFGATGLARGGAFDGLTGPVLLLVAGVVALFATSRVRDQTIAIAVTILGLLAGGAGGTIVALAGILSIVSRHALKQ